MCGRVKIFLEIINIYPTNYTIRRGKRM